MSFTQPSPAAIAVYSHVRQQPSASHEAPMSTVLYSARGEILRVMEHMIEKNQQQVIEFIVEVLFSYSYFFNQLLLLLLII